MSPLATEWIPANVRTPAGCEHDGMIDFSLAPHIRGVLEAWDDPYVREITLCWGSRTQKTTTLLALAIFAAATTSDRVAIRSGDKRFDDLIRDEVLDPMLLRCKKSVPIPRSPRNYEAKYVFAIDADRWPRGEQPDPLRTFLDSAKYVNDAKVIKESVPGELSRSRIWADLTSETTDQRRFFVQCPHCRHYQTLDFGDEHSAHGIKWQNHPHCDDLQLAKESALESAWYQCINRQCWIHNEDRPQLIRSGVWLSDGQSISADGKISGEPNIRSPHIGFGPLGQEYSLLIPGWGSLAADFLVCKQYPNRLRDFTNSCRGLPWDANGIAVMA